MIERVRVNNISQINKIVHAASCQNRGLLRLDYSRPVEVVSENARALRACVRACMA